MNKVIVIRGRKRSGKDTTALMLKEEIEARGYSVEIMSFAEPMKDILATTLGISLEQLDDFKNNNNDVYVDYVTGYDINNCRLMLQMFGTEAMKKHFGDDVWVNLTRDKIRKSTADFVIISDWRFPNEYNVLDNTINFKVQTVHVVNPRVSTSDTHSSEIALDDFECNHRIMNDGTLEDLRLKIKGIM